MGVEWQRWLRYAKAKIDLTVSEGEREMDRLESEQAAASEGKPWLSSTGDAPTLDETRARIEDRAGRAGVETPATGSGDEAFDAEAQRRAAEERLAAIRDELGLGDEPEQERDDDGSGPAPPGPGAAPPPAS